MRYILGQRNNVYNLDFSLQLLTCTPSPGIGHFSVSVSKLN